MTVGIFVSFWRKNVKIAAFAAETAKIGATNESKDKRVYRSVFKNSQPTRDPQNHCLMSFWN
jgi:hypothetical protein